MKGESSITYIWWTDNIKQGRNHIIRSCLFVISQSGCEDTTTRGSTSQIQLRRPVQCMANDFPIDSTRGVVSYFPGGVISCRVGIFHKSMEWYMGTPGKTSKVEVARK